MKTIFRSLYLGFLEGIGIAGAFIFLMWISKMLLS